MREFKPRYPDLLEKFGGDLNKYHEYLRRLSDDLRGEDEDRSIEVLAEACRCRTYLGGNPQAYVCRACPNRCVFIDQASEWCLPNNCLFDGKRVRGLWRRRPTKVRVARGRALKYACGVCRDHKRKDCNYIDRSGAGGCPGYCPYDGDACEWVVEEPGDTGVSPIIVGS